MELRRRWDLIGDDCVRRDADLAFAILWTYNGVGIDLTGHVLELKIRLADGSGNALLTIDNAANGGITLADQSIVLTDPRNPNQRGGAFYRITQAQIAALAPGRYSYTTRDLTGGGITSMWLGFIEFAGPTS